MFANKLLKLRVNAFWALSLLLLLSVIMYSSSSSEEPKGFSGYFEDHHFHFEALRGLAYAPYGGADAGEVLAVTQNIRDNNFEDWYREWYKMAEHVETKGRNYSDKKGQGRALLRAHNYYRLAEFNLKGDDKRRLDTFLKSQKTFRDGLVALEVEFNEFDIPYGENTLKAIYYPGGPNSLEEKPLLVAINGFDGTLEETYFAAVAGALERGYSVLTFAGPGQGSVLRNQGLTFTPAWELPTGAVLDEFERRYGEPKRTVMMGISFGGLLAPRAVAEEKRIDGLISWNAMYDFHAAVMGKKGGVKGRIVEWLLNNDHHDTLNMLLNNIAATNSGVRWGAQNAKWVFDLDEPSEIFEAALPYNLKGVSEKITADVLLLWGDEDHFMGESQLHNLQNNLPNARSVETLFYTAEEGGKEHGQVGILTSVHADIFSWLEKRFPTLPVNVYD